MNILFRICTYVPLNKPLRRGGPLCPPARFGTVLAFVVVTAALAGRFKNPVSKFAVTYHRTNLCVGADRRVRPRVSMPIGFIVVVLLFIDAYAALAGWMHRVCADLAGCYENTNWCSVRLGWLVA